MALSIRGRLKYVSEDVVREVISRPDELRDLVDGEIGESELESMFAAFVRSLLEKWMNPSTTIDELKRFAKGLGITTD